MVNSADINVVEPVKVLGLRLEKMAHMCDAGVVDQNIESMQPGESGPHGIRVSDIKDQNPGTSPVRLDQAQRLLSRGGRNIHHRNLGPFRSQTLRDGATNA